MSWLFIIDSQVLTCVAREAGICRKTAKMGRFVNLPVEISDFEKAMQSMF